MDGAAVDIVADVKYVLRRLKQSLGFTATVIVTLALGIGATTAVFTLIQQVMLRSLAVAKPQQLWRIGDAVTCCYSTGYLAALIPARRAAGVDPMQTLRSE